MFTSPNTQTSAQRRVRDTNGGYTVVHGFRESKTNRFDDVVEAMFFGYIIGQVVRDAGFDPSNPDEGMTVDDLTPQQRDAFNARIRH